MREVKNSVRDAGRCAIRRDVAQANADESSRPVDCKRHIDCRRAEDLEVFAERLAVETKRLAVVGALVAGQLRAWPVLKPWHQFARIEAERLRRLPLDGFCFRGAF